MPNKISFSNVTKIKFTKLVVFIPDSQYSPSEDFANSVELYYSDRSRLKIFNLKS